MPRNLTARSWTGGGRFFPDKRTNPNAVAAANEQQTGRNAMSASLTSAANLERSSSIMRLPHATILSVQPVVLSGTVSQGGGLYCQVILLRGEVDVARDRVQVLWSGYIRQSMPVASFPGSQVTEGMGLVFRLWAGTESGNIAINVNVSLGGSGAVGAAGFILQEQPGSGQGVIRAVDLGNPAAGNDYAVVIVPDQVTWRPLAVNLQFATSAVAGNRVVWIEADTPGSAFLSRTYNPRPQPASQTWRYGFARGHGTEGYDVGTNRVHATLPDLLWPEGSLVFVGADGKDVADDFAQGFLSVEEWAVPS